MRLIGNIISGIIVLLAVPLLVMAACNLAIVGSLLTRETYQDMLADEAIFENLSGAALPAITAASAEEMDFGAGGNAPIQITDIATALEDDPQAWATVTEMLVPATWLQSTVNQAADVLFSIFEGDVSVVESEFDLSEVRERLQGESAVEAATIIIESAPACTPEQTRTLIEFLDTFDCTMPICQAENDALRAQSISALELWFSSLAQILVDDTLTVSELFGLNRDQAQQVHLALSLAQQSFLLLFLCPMAFLSIVVIVSVRNLSSFGRWIGGTTIATGLLLLLIVFLTQLAVFGIISDAVAASNSSTAEGIFLSRFGAGLARAVFGQSSQTLFLQSAGYIGAGFVIVALGWYFSQQDSGEDSLVLISEEGEIISTVSKQKLNNTEETETLQYDFDDEGFDDLP
ncbi:MAG: hypothetical protein AAF126_21935 [Chloroflexota bacterium]